MRLNKEQIDSLMSLTNASLNKKKLKELFADTANKKALYDPSDQFELNLEKFDRLAYGKDELIVRTVKSKTVLTTVGRYIFNLYVNNPDDLFVYKLVGYINKPLSGDEMNAVDSELGKALIEKEITGDQFIDYLDRRDNLGYFVVNFLGANLTVKGMIPLKSVTDRKKALFKQNEEEIANGNISIVSDMEKELLDLANNELKGGDDLEIFKSGARGTFDNNYKNTSVMRGVLFSSDGQKRVAISEGNLMDGIPKDEIPFYNDLSIYSFYSKGVETQEGGYVSKQLASSFQGLVLDEPGSNCGTKKTITIKLTEKNRDKYLMRYIIEKGSLVLLDKENTPSRVGTYVNMRSPLYCTNENICSKCAGELYYRLGITNVGLIANIVGTTILNLNMKKFHDTSIKVREFDVEKSITKV